MDVECNVRYQIWQRVSVCIHVDDRVFAPICQMCLPAQMHMSMYVWVCVCLCVCVCVYVYLSCNDFSLT